MEVWEYAPLKVVFFVWTAAHGKLLNFQIWLENWNSILGVSRMNNVSVTFFSYIGCTPWCLVRGKLLINDKLMALGPYVSLGPAIWERNWQLKWPTGQVAAFSLTCSFYLLYRSRRDGDNINLCLRTTSLSSLSRKPWDIEEQKKLQFWCKKLKGESETGTLFLG